MYLPVVLFSVPIASAPISLQVLVDSTFIGLVVTLYPSTLSISVTCCKLGIEGLTILDQL